MRVHFRRETQREITECSTSTTISDFNIILNSAQNFVTQTLCNRFSEKFYANKRLKPVDKKIIFQNSSTLQESFKHLWVQNTSYSKISFLHNFRKNSVSKLEFSPKFTFTIIIQPRFFAVSNHKIFNNSKDCQNDSDVPV